nr:hypothetical protein [Crateriforma spongiae]
MIRFAIGTLTLFGLLLGGICRETIAADGSRYAHHDGNARFLHHIDLYDVNNRKITPESDQPYSPLNTCGRCHDYQTIAHGWHFNALLESGLRPDDGRASEPWIWTDPRTGTQLPLSTRDHGDRFDPREIGISDFELIRHFGARLPGTIAVPAESDSEKPSADAAEDDSSEPGVETRWELTGTLEIDCMVCHAVSGRYDMELRREQVEKENFAWVPTAAIRLGIVNGEASRIKTGSDLSDESVQSKLPTVEYDANRFGQDGTVFFDLVRMPEDNACYQCHSNRSVGDHGIEPRWIHDEDIHLRAGMVCVDCHRNGIDHDIVRGFEGQIHVTGQSIQTLSCRGCHYGVTDESTAETIALAGRLASPMPEHAGLPALHFEKLACTTCHSGPAPSESAKRTMTSLAHSLGSKDHRTGDEWPAIIGPIYDQLTQRWDQAMSDEDAGQESPNSSDDEADTGHHAETGHQHQPPESMIYPQRGMWPSFFASVDGDALTPLPPETVFEVTRRSLRVRKDFVAELTLPKLGRSDRQEVLGEERGGLKDEELTTDELAKLEQKQAELGRAEFDEKLAAALEAIQKEMQVERAAYVSAGQVYVTRTSADLNDDVWDGSGTADSLTELALLDPGKFAESTQQSIDLLTWPLAHNVRGAGQALGAKGCLECHSDQGKVFTSTVQAVGPAPFDGDVRTMASLQGIDEDQRLRWNQMFTGRYLFKYVIGGSLLVVFIAILGGLAAKAGALSVFGENYRAS